MFEAGHSWVRQRFVKGPSKVSQRPPKVRQRSSKVCQRSVKVPSNVHQRVDIGQSKVRQRSVKGWSKVHQRYVKGHLRFLEGSYSWVGRIGASITQRNQELMNLNPTSVFILNLFNFFFFKKLQLPLEWINDSSLH